MLAGSLHDIEDTVGQSCGNTQLEGQISHGWLHPRGHTMALHPHSRAGGQSDVERPFHILAARANLLHEGGKQPFFQHGGSFNQSRVVFSGGLGPRWASKPLCGGQLSACHRYWPMHSLLSGILQSCGGCSLCMTCAAIVLSFLGLDGEFCLGFIGTEVVINTSQSPRMKE